MNVALALSNLCGLRYVVYICICKFVIELVIVKWDRFVFFLIPTNIDASRLELAPRLQHWLCILGESVCANLASQHCHVARHHAGMWQWRYPFRLPPAGCNRFYSDFLPTAPFHCPWNLLEHRVFTILNCQTSRETWPTTRNFLKALCLMIQFWMIGELVNGSLCNWSWLIWNFSWVLTILPCRAPATMTWSCTISTWSG